MTWPGLASCAMQIVSGSFLGSLFLLFRLFGLPRGLVQYRLDFLLGRRLIRLVDRGDLARHPIQRSLVELALAVGLLRLSLRAEQVAHHLGDGHQVARIDLGFVFLCAAAPHRALDTWP